MQVLPPTNGGLRVDHKPVAGGAFPAPVFLHRLTSSAWENRCPVCCSIKVAEEWVDPVRQPDVMFFSDIAHRLSATLTTKLSFGRTLARMSVEGPSSLWCDRKGLPAAL
jgi:RNA polymerase subunit RPABC4/transcription elongation factor Spt4